MQKQDFYFNLPEELIAQYPAKHRTASRLLVYQRDNNLVCHYHFNELSKFLNAGDLLVLNNSKVIPARLYGNKVSGGKVELLVERILNANSFLTQIKASKSPKINTIIELSGDWCLRVEAKNDHFYYCSLVNNLLGDVTMMLHQIGNMPLPPYIRRVVDRNDFERYQTVYATLPGSVAAPTAGLHFDEQLLAELINNGINIGYITLHIGSGTFQPLRTANLDEHKMHKEQFIVNEELVAAVKHTKALGKRVIAVGTTAMRGLESAVKNNVLQTCAKETEIFIAPGYKFQVCDGLLTNFHLPESTLLVLVAAFIGYLPTMALYQEAILQRYHFFSYGDACLLL